MVVQKDVIAEAPAPQILYTSIPMDHYEKVIASNAREDIQINLPASDIFSEEMRVIISNTNHANVFT